MDTRFAGIYLFPADTEFGADFRLQHSVHAAGAVKNRVVKNAKRHKVKEPFRVYCYRKGLTVKNR